MSLPKKALAIILVSIFIFSVCATSLSSFAKSSESLKIDDSLPIVYIDTDSKINPGRDDNSEYFDGSMRIELNNYYADCENAYTTSQMKKMGIRTRGNSTRTFAGAVDTGKFSYRLKLEEKADLFGMGASKNWALLANVYDQTNMRNTFAYELAKALGVAYCDSTWVVLYLNGEYRGLYQLCETISVAKTRLDITDWGDIVKDAAQAIAKKELLDSAEAKELEKAMEKDLSWVTSGKFQNYKISDYYDKELDITSGYLIEYDSFDNPHDDRPHLFDGGTTPAGVELKIDTPEYTYTNSDMLGYVRELILNFEEAVTAPNFCTSDGRHYSEFCDIESLVDYYLINAVLMNGEFGIRSMFFYIEDGKIHWGPVWDFDCAAGNAITVTTSYEGMIGTQGGRNHWYKALYNDSYFMTLVQNRFAAIRGTLDAAIESVKIYRQYIAAEANRDYQKYGSRYFNDPSNTLESFDKEFAFYLNWQKNRIAWLEKAFFSGDYSIMGEMPYSDKLTVQLNYSDGKGKLASDTLTQYGAVSSFIYSPQTGGTVKMRFMTTHTTVTKVLLFVNGKFCKEVKLNDISAPVVTLGESELCLEKGARNSVHLVLYNIDGNPYRRYGFSILVGDVPETDQKVVQINGSYTLVKEGDCFTLPSAPKNQSGLEFVGWTDGEDIYAAGSTITVSESMALYEKWTHTDMKSVLFVDSTEILYGNTYINPKEDSENDNVANPPTEPGDNKDNKNDESGDNTRPYETSGADSDREDDRNDKNNRNEWKVLIPVIGVIIVIGVAVAAVIIVVKRKKK